MELDLQTDRVPGEGLEKTRQPPPRRDKINCPTRPASIEDSRDREGVMRVSLTTAVLCGVVKGPCFRALYSANPALKVE